MSKSGGDRSPGNTSPTSSSSKKKKKVVDGDAHNESRAIAVIHVASGETEVAVDGHRSAPTHLCFVSEEMTASSSSTLTARSSVTSLTTPLEVSRRRSRARGRKSYWRRRMEQFDHENEQDVAVEHTSRLDNANGGGSSASLADEMPSMRRPSALYQEGCIASLPLLIQVAFRRKMFSVFALQLLFISALMVLLTYENALSSIMDRAFQHTGWYLFGTLAVMVVFLVLLYLGHAVFPLNWFILVVFSVALSVFLASVQVYLDTNAGLFCCGFTFFAVSIMIPLSGIERRAETDGASADDRVLLSTTKAGLIAFTIVLVCAVIVFAIFDNRFVSSGSAFGLSVVLEFALILWFSYDASTMYSIMSPDEYMSGVIFFYTDLLVVIVIIIVFGALALLFSSAGMGAGGFGGSCDCFGCLRAGRVFGGDAEAGGGTTSSPVLPMTDSVSRRDSVGGATVVPEEMLR